MKDSDREKQPSLDDLPELEPVDEDGPDSLDDLPELLPEEDAAEAEARVVIGQTTPEAEVEDLPELLALEEPAGEDFDHLPELEAVQEPAEESGAQAATETASYRKIYETLLRDLTRDARVDRAHKATGELLCALCLDAEPAVIHAVLDNAEVGFKHARLIAEHHPNPVGLDAMGRRAEFLRDAAVRRLLLRNIQAPDTLLKRALAPDSLHQVFRINMGHDNSERARRVARDVLREKFLHTSPEDRVGLVLKTEGRCLMMLVGVTFDQKMTALLCSRTYQSTLLVQSLARFPALPPNLINALFKQQLVQRSPQLKKLLLAHKNCPGQHKR